MKNINIDFLEKYPNIRYVVVLSQPSLKELKYDHLKMAEEGVGYGNVITNITKDKKNCTVQELMNHPSGFFEVLFEMKKIGAFATYNFEIMNIDTGEVYSNYYKDVHSYHPEEGYVIFEKQSERFVQSAVRTYVIVSLKTGKELPGEFVNSISGIKGLFFEGIKASENNPRSELYKIDEFYNNFITVDRNSINLELPEPNKNNFSIGDSFGCGVLFHQKELPFFCSTEFINAAKNNDALFKLFEFKRYELSGYSMRAINMSTPISKQINLDISIEDLRDFYLEEIYNVDLDTYRRAHYGGLVIDPNFCEPKDEEPNIEPSDFDAELPKYSDPIEDVTVNIENNENFCPSINEMIYLDKYEEDIYDDINAYELDKESMRQDYRCRLRERTAPEIFKNYFEPFFNSTLKNVYENNLTEELEFYKPEFERWVFMMLAVMTEYYFREEYPNDHEMNGIFTMNICKGNGLSEKSHDNFNFFYRSIPW